VHESAGAARTTEHFVAARIVNSSRGHDAVLFDRDRNTIERILVGEIRGSIQRINDPTYLGAGLRFRDSGFFGKDGVIGIATLNAMNDERFAFLVCNRDQVGAPLELHLLLTVRVVFQYVTGMARQLDG